MKTIAISALVALVLIGGYASALSADRIMLSSDNEADATVASAIAADINAALVITPRTVFSEEVLAAIKDANPRKVIIIGGSAAVPQEYADALKEAGIEAKVVGGKTRQQTSILAYAEFRNELDRKPVIADGRQPIAVQDAIPIYAYDDNDEIRGFAKANANAMATNQAAVENANLGLEVRAITEAMVADVKAEIAKFKESQDKSGIVLATEITAIASVHGGKISALAKTSADAKVATTGGVNKPGAAGLSTDINASGGTKITAQITEGQSIPLDYN